MDNLVAVFHRLRRADQFLRPCGKQHRKCGQLVGGAVGKRSPYDRQSVGIAVLLAVEIRQVVQYLSDLGMIGTECLLGDRQGPFIEKLGVCVTAFALMQPGQIVQQLGDLRVIAAERLFLNGQ